MPYSNLPADYYAVIFTSQRTADDDAGYAAMAQRMQELVRLQPGFLGFESARGGDGLGITVSYWQDLASINAWREQFEHRAAQAKGKETWYASFELRIAKVERHVKFEQ